MITRGKIALLKELQQLLKDELLTQEEFERARLALLTEHGGFNIFARRFFGFVRATSWPLFGLVALLVLYRPIVDTLQKSQEIAVGSFSLKVREQAAKVGDADLAATLRGLSRYAIEELMDTGNKNMYFVSCSPADDKCGIAPEFEAYKELEKAGLFKATEPLAKFDEWIRSLPGKYRVIYESRHTNYMHPTSSDIVYEVSAAGLSDADRKRLSSINGTLTEKGLRAWKLIAKVVSQQLAGGD